MKLRANIHFLASRLSETPAHQRKMKMDEVAEPVLNFIKKKIVGTPLIKKFSSDGPVVKIEIEPFWFQRARLSPEKKIPEFILRRLRKIDSSPDFKFKMVGNTFELTFNPENEPEQTISKLKKDLESMVIPPVEDIRKSKHSFQFVFGSSPLFTFATFQALVFRLVYFKCKLGEFGDDLKNYAYDKSIRGGDKLAITFQDLDLSKVVEEEKVDEESSIGSILADFGANVDFRPGSNEGLLEGIPTKIQTRQGKIYFSSSNSVMLIFEGDLDEFTKNSIAVEKFIKLWPKLGKTKKTQSTGEIWRTPYQDQPTTLKMDNHPDLDGPSLDIDPDSDIKTVGDRIVQLLTGLGFKPLGDELVPDVLVKGDLQFAPYYNFSFDKGNGKVFLGFNLTTNPRVNDIILQEAYNMMRMFS